MNITPMNMQVVIPKVTEVGKSQQTRDHQNVVQQEHGAAQFQQVADHRLRQVQTLEKPEGKKVKNNNEQKEKQESGKQQSYANAKKVQEEEMVMAVDTLRGGTIDIKM